jgi:ribokinase
MKSEESERSVGTLSGFNGEVIVIGSVNMDLVMQTERIPLVGETVYGNAFNTYPGGKGGNQAVAASALGAKVSMLTTLGDDAFSLELLRSLEKRGVNVSYIEKRANGNAGIAMIFVDKSGKNTIAFTPGSNQLFSKTDLLRTETLFSKGKILLITQEMSNALVYESIVLAHKKGMYVILDPAPANPELFVRYPELPKCIDILKPNETETASITGNPVDSLEDAYEAVLDLKKKGFRLPLITLGEKGSVTLDGEKPFFSPAFSFHTIDTTAAGDVFSGALAAGLSSGMAYLDALRFASASAGLSTTRAGAQSSVPSLQDVNHFLEEQHV